jgi:hypothetical protein
MKNKKIGLLTFHCADNFGAVLQAYALQKYIHNTFNVNIEIIDYRPSQLVKPYKLDFSNAKNFIEKIKIIIKKILSQKKYNERLAKFEEFRLKYFEFSAKRNITKDMLNTLTNEYECFLVGSDQVWNPSFVGDIGSSYLLDFLPEDSYKVSYASSVVEVIPDSLQSVYKKYLERFNFISVREEGSKKILQKIIDKDINVNIDPVFLLEKECWEKIIKIPLNRPKKDFILVFDYVLNSEYVKIANIIADYLGLECVTYSINYFWNRRYINNKKSLFFEGPCEILWYIKNASLILTSSFHALAFSIIFEKKFLCLLHPSRGNRMIDILNKLELTQYLIEESLVESEIINIIIKLINSDFKYNRDQLQLLKKDAFLYLNEIVNYLNSY